MTASLITPLARALRLAPRRLGVLVCTLCLAGFAAAALADKITHPTAVFEGLDKITGRIISFEVAIGETVQFGTLQITPHVCYSRPATEAPQTDVFAQVDEIDEQKQEKLIFSGWMFADSPGLHGIEHPIYDIWLKDCKGGTTIIHDKVTVEASAPKDNPFSGEGADASSPLTPETPAPPKKRKPKPAPAVVAAPAPAPAAENAPLELTPSNSHGR